jgi:myosin heavy subunit
MDGKYFKFFLDFILDAEKVPANFCAVLDIAGFEIFEVIIKNSAESN